MKNINDKWKSQEGYYYSLDWVNIVVIGKVWTSQVDEVDAVEEEYNLQSSDISPTSLHHACIYVGLILPMSFYQIFQTNPPLPAVTKINQHLQYIHPLVSL